MPLLNHRARKRFGQNFLNDPGIIQRIIRSINPKPEQTLVEIGPGQGALTEGLLNSGCFLNAVELDRDLIPILQQAFNANERFELHQGDALHFDFRSLLTDDSQQLRVVGNLPYNISTPLIFHLLDQHDIIQDMHFMLQLEVVKRLAAEPGNKNYGRLSVMAQYFCQVSALFEVPPEAFDPRPKVQSAIVCLIPHRQLPHPADDINSLGRILKTAFNQRRKTLRNSLKTEISTEGLCALDIDPAARPETLSLQQFVAISNAVSANTVNT